MRESNFKTSPRLRRMLVALLCISAIIYQAGAQTLVTFDNTSDLSTYFTEGLPATLPMTNRSDLGLGNSACINVQANSFDIWTTKAGYSVSGAGDVYVLSAYFKNRGGNGYGALGFSTTVANTIDNYAAPVKGMGMSFHGGGGMFINNRAQTAVNWANGGLTIGANSTWYKMILTVTAKGSNTYDLNFQIWNSDTNGVLTTKLDEHILNGVVNTDIGGASILHVYFAAAGDRMEKIDNFSISLSGGATIIDAGKPVVVTNAVSAITSASASCGGNVSDDQGAAVTAKGVCWSTTSGPTIADSKSTDGTGTGTFTSSISSLSPGTTYYVRAYATNTNGTSYGSEVSFTTSAVVVPSLSTSTGAGAFTVGNASAVVIDPNVTVSSGTTIDNGLVYINSGLISADDNIIYPASLYGVTGVYTASTGVLQLSGTATVAQYQEIFRSIQYKNTNTAAVAGSRSFTFSLGSALPFTPTGSSIAHYYEFIPNAGITWTAAKAAADAKTYYGLKGYLVTIMSAAENNFAFKSIAKYGWIGASDAASEGNWKWVTGPEAGTLFYTGAYPSGTAVGGNYNNFDMWEPNNYGGIEDYAHFKSDGTWNDFADNNTGVAGYYVEYGGMTGDPVISISGSKLINLTVTPPTITTSTGSDTMISGNNIPVVIDPNVVVSSTNSATTVDNGLVYINSGLISSEDKIIYPAVKYGVSASYNAATGVLLLTGTATIAQYQEIFRTIQYQNINTAAAPKTRSFTFALGNALPFTPCGASSSHYYEFVPVNLSWTAAKAAAEARSYFGLKGYLTTITCAEENNFAYQSIGKKGWIGASDAATEGDWKWVTGPEAGTSFYSGNGGSGGTTVSGMYSNWYPGEPNNSGGSENYAHFYDGGKWNDWPENNTVDGYYVEYGGLTGESALNISAVKLLTITLNPPTAAAAQAVCGSGTVADLVATPPIGSSVRWYNVATAGTVLTSTTALITATTYYAESWNGSSASPTRTAVVLTINVIPAKPVLVPTSTAKIKVKLCPGDNIVCSNFDNTLSYQWKLNGTNLNGQTANQYKVPVGGAGTYSLYVKNPTTGCDNLSATVNVDLYSITTPVIYEKKKSDYISILIVDNTSKFYTSYSWTYADGSVLPTGIVTDRQFLVLPPANMAASYMVNITDTNACKVTSAVKTVALHTIAAKAYPTMNNGNFMVGLTDAQDGKLNVKIFNQNGILQKLYAFDNVSSEFEYQVNAAGLQAGAYTVEISLGDYVQSQKIIIR